MKKIFKTIGTGILPAILLAACNNSQTATTEASGINFTTAIIIIIVIFVAVAFSFWFFKNVFPVGLWFKAVTAGVRIGVRSFFNMYFQKIPPEPIVTNMIKARKAGINLMVKQLEDYYLANVDLDIIVDGLIKAYNSGVETNIEQLSNAYLADIDIPQFVDALVMVSNANIETNFEELKTLYLTGADVVEVVKAKIECENSGFSVDFMELAQHYLADGNLGKTVNAYISARKANLPDFDFSDIADIDLAGYDVEQIVQKAIIPVVVEGDRVRGVARDGVELSMKVKVTLRAKLKYIIGSPEESTILARINEGLATEIGLSESHYFVLENPFELADRVEKRKLDVDSAFEVLSIDVSDITIGKDVHAELRTERAKADAEKYKANLIKADEKLKTAMASAFLDGNLTPKDYEKLMNIQADTKMREKLSENQNLNIDDNDENEEEENEQNNNGEE